jgi:Uma2 family endonuclease
MDESKGYHSEPMEARTAVPLPEPSGDDQVVLLHGVPWSQYEALLDVRTGRQPFIAYLDGTLELVTHGLAHEWKKTLLARLLEAFAGIRKRPLNGFGNSTFKRKAKRAGLEPDECYWLGKRRGPAQLAIEVVETSGGVDKLEIYRRLGVQEVWFLIGGRIHVYRLDGKRYHSKKSSTVLRGVDLTQLGRLVSRAKEWRQTETVEAYRRALRKTRARPK